MRDQRSVDPGFVRAHTTVRAAALVPEIELHVADDVVALWEALEQERGSAPEEPPFWAAAWPGGLALARYVLDTPDVVAGRAVLDLGSGSGLVAVAAALAGAGRVTASEIDPVGQAAIAVNAAGNGIGRDGTGRIGVGQIGVVGDVLDDDPPPDGPFPHDVVLAGDVCYDRAMTERVLPFLDRAAAAGSTVLLGDPGRPYLPRTRLRRLATYSIPDGDGGGPRTTTVWRWR